MPPVSAAGDDALLELVESGVLKAPPAGASQRILKAFDLPPEAGLSDEDKKRIESRKEAEKVLLKYMEPFQAELADHLEDLTPDYDPIKHDPEPLIHQASF